MNINFFFWVEHKVSLVLMYVCIVLISSPFKYVLFYFPIPSLARKSSVYWSISLVKLLLGGREISIITGASVFTVASLLSKVLKMLRCVELDCSWSISSYWGISCHTSRCFCTYLVFAWLFFCRFSLPEGLAL